MVHAAATWIGLFFVGLLATQGANAAALALGAAVCALASVYLFGAERAQVRVMLSALGGVLGRTPAVLRGAAGTLRAAAAADVTLRPALVQVRTWAEDDFSLGALVCAMSAAPGAVAVDASDDNVLVHVIEEHDESAAELSAIEAGVVGRSPRGRA
jgi:multisubunit Na+/H+ antiporter MnhE subunit